MATKERYVMRRRDGVLETELRPGEYCQLRRGQGWGDIALAIWRCPECGTTSMTARRVHHVDHDGDMMPGSMCPGVECKFAEFIHLEGWVPEPQGSA